MKILLIDIETAPNLVYAWGMFNQNLSIDKIVEPGYTMCFSAKWLGEDEVMFFSVYDDGEYRMVQAAHDLLDHADAVIHFNGSNFDIPILNKEFLLNRMDPPEPYKQIDLLQTVRKQFKFASNKLDYVCQQLGLGAKEVTKGMDLWKGCMNRDPESWREMESYNRRDTILLEDLYHVLLPWIEKHPNYALYMETEGPVCPNCGSSHLQSRGTQHNTFTQSYRRMKCIGCGSWVRERFTSLPKEKRHHVMTKAV